MISYGTGSNIRSFSVIHSLTYFPQLSDKIRNEIEDKGKEYVLSVDEEEFKKYLIDKYSIEPLHIDFENEQINKPTITKESVQPYYSRGGQTADVYCFIISYPFTGSSIVFSIKPSTFVLISEEININEQTKLVSFSFKLFNQDPNQFQIEKNRKWRDAFANNRLGGIVDTHLRSIKTKFERENNFFAAINVKVNKDTSSVFAVPAVKKKSIPQPTVAKNKEFSSEPMLAKTVYDEILQVIYDSGKNMEKKPALYQGKDENGLRDQFLFVLETRYEGTTATGETFNRGGKTDIILKYAKDGSNLFVAECKFWKGESEFLKAISQLFDGYLTWRDSKAALIMFVTNKEFTNVLQKITTEIKNHPYYIRENGKNGESTFSYIFRLPQDENKSVFFEVMAFHYDK